jgi:hypothetical protein
MLLAKPCECCSEALSLGGDPDRDHICVRRSGSPNAARRSSSVSEAARSRRSPGSEGHRPPLIKSEDPSAAVAAFDERDAVRGDGVFAIDLFVGDVPHSHQERRGGIGHRAGRLIMDSHARKRRHRPYSFAALRCTTRIRNCSRRRRTRCTPIYLSSGSHRSCSPRCNRSRNCSFPCISLCSC